MTNERILFEQSDIESLDRIYRINLINSLSGYKSANLIGTISERGTENLAVFSSVVHLGSNPPLLGFILRPNTVPRHTYSNLKATGLYTINHISKGFYKDAHHTSAKYDEQISEFDKTGLTPAYLHDFNAPFVQESSVKIGMRYLEEYPIAANDTILIVGEIVFFEIEKEMLQTDGFLNLAEANTAAINGLDGYSFPGSSAREGYQRPIDKADDKAG